MDILLPERVSIASYIVSAIVINNIRLQDELDLKLKDAHSSLDELDVDDLYVRYKVRITIQYMQ